jgi:hypothetical protein
MNNKELLEYIQNESKGYFKTIDELKNDSSEYGKKFRKQVRDLLKKDRSKQLKTANKLTFAERFFKRSEKEKRIVDSITGAEYSFERMAKNTIKKSLLKPSGRQLRKEKRFLREQLKTKNVDKPEEIR